MQVSTGLAAERRKYLGVFVNLLLIKHRTRQRCRKPVPRLLRAIADLRSSGFAALRTLGESFASWLEEIARMWRSTRNNGITEGFHTKMELLQRLAYGFRNSRAIVCGLSNVFVRFREPGFGCGGWI